MIIKAANQQLIQLREIVSQLTEEEYREAHDVFDGSSIGSHSRHILEFYICLIQAAETKELNYDLRKRDLLLESDKYECLGTIEDVILKLPMVYKGQRLTLSTDFSSSGDQECSSVETSFCREILYNVEHTIHHLAIIKIGLKSIGANVRFDKNMGVAAATIRNKKECVQ